MVYGVAGFFNFSYMKSVYLFLIIFIYGINAYAHKDFTRFEKYGNIEVSITTGYEYEEINNVFIIAQLAEKLSVKLNYNKPIYLIFKHNYTNRGSYEYSVDYSIGDFKDWCEGCVEKKNNFGKLIIRQKSKSFSAEETIKLIEFSILNLKLLKKFKDSPIMKWSGSDLKPLKNKSNAVLEVLNNKIYRPEENFNYGISYYWQNGFFNFFYRDFGKEDKIILKIPTLYAFERFSYTESFIFDTNSSFYYQKSWPEPIISKHQTITNTYNNFRPLKIRDINSATYSLNMVVYTEEEGLQPRDKTLLYMVKEDRLIQDFNSLTKKD